MVGMPNLERARELMAAGRSAAALAAYREVAEDSEDPAIVATALLDSAIPLAVRGDIAEAARIVDQLVADHGDVEAVAARGRDTSEMLHAALAGEVELSTEEAA